MFPLAILDLQADPYVLLTRAPVANCIATLLPLDLHA